MRAGEAQADWSAVPWVRALRTDRGRAPLAPGDGVRGFRKRVELTAQQPERESPLATAGSANKLEERLPKLDHADDHGRDQAACLDERNYRGAGGAEGADDSEP